MRKLTLLLSATAMLIAGCGLKQPPQPVAESGPPQIVSLQQSISGNVLKLEITLAGGSRGVGYQIDRSEEDPYCKCPSFWQRFYEEPPVAKNSGATLEKLLHLSLDKPYLFRIRAIDGVGRLGPWSKPIRAIADPRTVPQ